MVSQGGLGLKNYSIIGPHTRDAWTPENGRFYESKEPDGSGFKHMMRDGWIHVEQTLTDGAVAYYEVNEAGSVREAKLPYPFDEYRVEIPPHMILREEQIASPPGTRTMKTTLKWSAGIVIQKFIGHKLLEVDCRARLEIDQRNRLIRVLEPRNLPPGTTS